METIRKPNPIRKLDKSEVECRVSTGAKKSDGTPYATYLLYKDARVDMKILDEVYGPMNWQREHTLIGDRLYCTISIFDTEKGQWIKKQDVGTESNSEPEKGQASDAFKRAAFNVGIGRELYTAPYISVDLKQGEYSSCTDSKTNKEKITPKLNLYVDDLDYDKDGNINVLVLKDRRGNIRYSLGQKAKQQVETPVVPVAPSTPQTPAKKRIVVGGKAWYSAVEKHAKGEDMTGAIEERYTMLDAEWESFFEAVNQYKRENNIQ